MHVVPLSHCQNSQSIFSVALSRLNGGNLVISFAAFCLAARAPYSTVYSKLRSVFSFLAHVSCDDHHLDL